MALKGIVENKNYTFSAANKTITFSSDYIGMSLSDITYITNIKSGVATVVYDPFDSTKGGVLNGLVLTLAYNTTSMSDSDPLQIIVGYTPKNADPQLVRKIDNANDVDNTAFLQNISDNLDFLNLALDQNEGIQMSTRDVSIKKDVSGAIVTSDGIEIPIALNKLNDEVIIDTLGYQTISFVISTNASWSGNIAFYGRNNNQQQYVFCPFSIQGNSIVNTGAVTIGTNSISAYLAPCIYRFIKIACTSYTGSGGQAAGSAVLKASSFHPLGNLSSLPVAANISTINGTTPGSPGGGSATATTGLSTSGFVVGSALNATTNPPNAASVLATNVPYPISIGAREQPYVGAVSGIFRYITVDANGRYQLAGDTAFRTPNMGTPAEQLAAGTTRGIGANINNINGAQSLNTADTSQVEGDTMAMMLKQILTELKILNQQITEIPFLMNAGQSKMSDPQEYRDDNSNLF